MLYYFFVVFCRIVLEEMSLQHYCVFTEWTYERDSVCKHCVRLEQGISLDMYRKYSTLDSVPAQERREMYDDLCTKYPLYFQIYNWLEGL